jgi:hypothetical protein
VIDHYSFESNIRLIDDSVKSCEQSDGAISVVLKFFDRSRERGRDGLQNFAREAQDREDVARRVVAAVGVARLADGILAYVRTPGGSTSPAQQVFRRTRTPATLRSRTDLTQSNRRGTGPYARRCGRGDVEGHPPIPINRKKNRALKLVHPA